MILSASLRQVHSEGSLGGLVALRSKATGFPAPIDHGVPAFLGPLLGTS